MWRQCRTYLKLLPPLEVELLPPHAAACPWCREWWVRAASQLTAEDTDPKLLTESASSSSLESGDLDGVSGCEAGVVGRELNWDDEEAADTGR